MKTKAILLATFFFLIGCFSDDDYVDDAALNGTWVLNNASCFCNFANDFDFSTHQLTFDSSEQRVVVNNPKDIFFIIESGTYIFSNDGRVLNINGKRYSYEIIGNAMQLTFVDNPDIADDEISLFYTTTRN